MLAIWFYTLLSVVVVSLISLVGIFTLALRQDMLRRILFYLVSFSVGALLGDVFIHIIPEIAEEGDASMMGMYLLVGIIAFFILERFVLWHHSHNEHEEGVHSVVYLTIFGDALHNFLDGMAIAASFLVSFPVGVATAIAVIFHEIPQEIGQFAILIHGGWSTKKALVYNFVSALTAILGAIVVLVLATSLEGITIPLLAISAASFIYIALSDLIPELNREPGAKKSVIQLFWMIIGILIMAALLWLE
jgi:zinc and cadmium transporter